MNAQGGKLVIWRDAAYEILRFDGSAFRPSEDGATLLRFGLASKTAVVDLEIRRGEHDQVGGGLVSHALQEIA